jgi:hypothetical protein
MGGLIRYLTLLPSFRVTERTVSFPSSVGLVMWTNGTTAAAETTGNHVAQLNIDPNADHLAP